MDGTSLDCLNRERALCLCDCHTLCCTAQAIHLSWIKVHFDQTTRDTRGSVTQHVGVLHVQSGSNNGPNMIQKTSFSERESHHSFVYSSSTGASHTPPIIVFLYRCDFLHTLYIYRKELVALRNCLQWFFPMHQRVRSPESGNAPHHERCSTPHPTLPL